LGNVRKNEKELFPEPAHRKSFVCRITMVKERLRKKRKIPVRYKKYNNEYHFIKLVFLKRNKKHATSADSKTIMTITTAVQM
jgi:hypothetical protein